MTTMKSLSRMSHKTTMRWKLNLKLNLKLKGRKKRTTMQTMVLGRRTTILRRQTQVAMAQCKNVNHHSHPFTKKHPAGRSSDVGMKSM